MVKSCSQSEDSTHFFVGLDGVSEKFNLQLFKPALTMMQPVIGSGETNWTEDFNGFSCCLSIKSLTYE